MPDSAVLPWLMGADGRRLVADTTVGPDPLKAAARLAREHPELTGTQRSAVLEQAGLREESVRKYGSPVLPWLTRDGLEQATRPEVARRRAHALADAGIRRVVDLTGGLGSDAAAFAAAGLQVTAFEADPVTAAMLAANVPAAHIVRSDATAPGALQSIAPADDLVVFCDPERRSGGRRGSNGARALPERDPERWSPPWSFVVGLGSRYHVAAKVAPGLRPPSGWHAEWISVDGDVVEEFVSSWPISSGGASRRATSMRAGQVDTIDDRGNPAVDAALPAIGSWLHDPDPAVIDAELIPHLAASRGLCQVPESTWLTGGAVPPTPLMRSMRLLEELPADTRYERLSGFRSVEFRGRGSGLDPDVERRRLSLRGAGHADVAFVRSHGRTSWYLVQPA